MKLYSALLFTCNIVESTTDNLINDCFVCQKTRMNRNCNVWCTLLSPCISFLECIPVITLVSYLRDLNLTLQRIREVKQAKKGLPKSASKEPLSGLNLNFLLACPITCSVSRKDKANPAVSAMWLATWKVRIVLSCPLYITCTLRVVGFSYAKQERNHCNQPFILVLN